MDYFSLLVAWKAILKLKVLLKLILLEFEFMLISLSPVYYPSFLLLWFRGSYSSN